MKGMTCALAALLWVLAVAGAPAAAAPVQADRDCYALASTRDHRASAAELRSRVLNCLARTGAPAATAPRRSIPPRSVAVADNGRSRGPAGHDAFDWAAASVGAGAAIALVLAVLTGLRLGGRLRHGSV